MNFLLHNKNKISALEVQSDELVIESEEDATHLLEALFNHSANSLILHREFLAPAFFDLRSGLAGAVLQKFTNYHVRVAIVGDFSAVTSESLKAFIIESNRGSQVFFVENVKAALKRLTAASN